MHEFATAIGPRRVGGRYFSGYWREEYTVLAIQWDMPVWGWQMTVHWADGHVTSHSTWWEAGRDRVVEA